MLDYYTRSGSSGAQQIVYGHDLDADASEYVAFVGFVPLDMVPGTDIVVMFRWCTTVINGGAETNVWWGGSYGRVGNSGAIPAPTAVASFTDASCVIPALEAAETIHETTWETIAGASPGDCLSLYIRRNADGGGDTYADDVMMFHRAFVEYTADPRA